MPELVLYQYQLNPRPASIEPIPFYIGIHEYSYTQPHYHPFAEIGFILEGHGVETVNGRTHRISPGTLSFIPPHCLHEMNSDTDQPIRKYCCLFDMKLLNKSDYDPGWAEWIHSIGQSTPSHALLDFRTEQQIRHLFENMKTEYDQTPQEGHVSILQARLTEAIILFRRTLGNTTPQPETKQPQQNEMIWEITHYLHMHFMEKITLNSVAQQFHFSSSYITRAFRTHMGISFLDYLHKLRIERATSLLTSTDMRILDISLEVGFDSFRTFSRVFKMMKGFSPTEFRKHFAQKQVPHQESV